MACLAVEAVAELEPQALLEPPVRLVQEETLTYKARHKVTALEVVAHKVAQMMRQGILLNTAVGAEPQETKTAQATQGVVQFLVLEAEQAAQGLVPVVLVLSVEPGVLMPQAQEQERLVAQEAEQAETATLEAMVVETGVVLVEQGVLVKKEEMAAWEVLQAGAEVPEPPRILAMVAMAVMAQMEQSESIVGR